MGVYKSFFAPPINPIHYFTQKAKIVVRYKIMTEQRTNLAIGSRIKKKPQYLCSLSFAAIAKFVLPESLNLYCHNR